MKKSFTLVELITVIAVISAIAAFSTGQYSSIVGDTRITKAKTDVKTIKDATVQYIYKTEHIPVNTSGLGINKTEFNLADKEYVMLNLDLLSNKQLLTDGTQVEASIQSIPTSASYIKAGVKNSKKQEPSFIYVLDNNFNVYLAQAKKDKETGYLIYTKIYETAEANMYDDKVKMYYEGNKPILETISKEEDNNTEDSTIIKDNIQINPELSTDIPNYGGNSGLENTESNRLYYKNLSVAGFTTFLDAYNIDLGKIKAIELEITAGSNTCTKTMYAVKATRWFARVDAKDLNNYSGYYKCKVYAITKDGEKIDIENFTTLVDRVKPVVTITKSKDDFYSSSNVKVSITASDSDVSSGIRGIEYKINDSVWKEYTGEITLTESDYYEIQAMAIDNFNNESNIATTIINDYTKPEIYLNKTNSGISIKLGVDVDDDDILWQNGFETTDKNVSLNVFNTPAYGTNGGQAVISNQIFEGLKAYRLLKNNDGNGNDYYYPSTSSNNSRIYFGSLSKTISNNMYLSVVYRYKSYDNSIVRTGLGGGWAKRIKYYNNIVMEDVPIGSTTIKLNTTANLNLGGHVTCDTDPTNPNNLPRIKSIDTQNNTITLMSKLTRVLKAGEKLAYRDWRSGGSFGNNSTVDTNGEWRLFTSVMKTTNYDDYDLYSTGVGFYMWNTASNELYIDNVKMGFASRMILYKNGERFNTTNQEYTTSYTDNDVSDKAKPTIDSISISKIEDNYNLDIKASDVGSKYEYYMESITRSGKVTKSKTRSYTVTSGVKQYYYIIDNYPNTTDFSKANKSSDSVINKTLDNNKAWYVHLIAEDGSGNKSNVCHKQIL